MTWGAFKSRDLPLEIIWAEGWVRYAFLEAASWVDLSELRGPSGEPVAPSKRPKADVRFRFASIAAATFDDLQARVTRLGPEPDRFARATRRRQLQDVFGPVSMPVIDVFVDATHPLVPDLIASPAGWYQIVVQEGFPEGDDLFALIGDPDAAGTDVVARLMRLDPAGAALPRLRDIFSLAHVGDLGDDDDGEPEPIPDPPPGGGQLIVGQAGVEWSRQEVEGFAWDVTVETDPLRPTSPAALQARLTS